MIQFPKNFRNASVPEIIANYPEDFKHHIYLCFKSLISDELGIRNSYYKLPNSDTFNLNPGHLVYLFGNECSCYCKDAYKIITSPDVKHALGELSSFSYSLKDKVINDKIWELCEFYNCSEYVKFKNGDYTNNVKNYYQAVFCDEFADKKEMIDNMFVNYLERKDAHDLPLYNLKFTIGKSCNYHCKSCKPVLEVEDVVLDDATIEELVKFISKYESITTGCMGEFFFRDNYLQIFKNKIDCTTFNLFTNGSLCNEVNFFKIHPDNIKNLKDIIISIDAATEDTYANVRSPMWKAVNRNIDFLKEIQKDYNFKLMTNYTISKLNMHEVIKFADVFHDKFDKIVYNFAVPVFNESIFKDTITDMNTRTEITNTIRDLHNTYPNILIQYD